MASESQWEGRWKTNRTLWHLSDVNPNLEEFFHELVTVGHGSSLRIFVPLCGKTTDMLWLAEKGHTVVGVEFVKMPIMNFFAENNLSFTTECVDIPAAGGSQLLYRCSNEGKNIAILHSSIFDVTDGVVGRKFHAIWDRASLSAINPEDRLKYVDLMRSILVPGGRCLLTTHRYDPKFGGPPHSFSEKLLGQLYEESFHIRELKMEEFPECEKEIEGRIQIAHEKYCHLLTLK